MTLREAIEFADDRKPNAFSERQKTLWLSDCEGKVQSEVFLVAPEDIFTYRWPENQDTELLVRPPYEKLYLSYLCAMIDFWNGEYGKYQNTLQLFNSDLSDFIRWFTDVYRPADTRWEGDEEDD